MQLEESRQLLNNKETTNSACFLTWGQSWFVGRWWSPWRSCRGAVSVPVERCWCTQRTSAPKSHQATRQTNEPEEDDTCFIKICHSDLIQSTISRKTYQHQHPYNCHWGTADNCNQFFEHSIFPWRLAKLMSLATHEIDKSLPDFVQLDRICFI